MGATVAIIATAHFAIHLAVPETEEGESDTLAASHRRRDPSFYPRQHRKARCLDHRFSKAAVAESMGASSSFPAKDQKHYPYY